MYASHGLVESKTVEGGVVLPAVSALEPSVVLAAHPTVQTALGSGTLA